MNLKSFRKGFMEAFIILSLLATSSVFAQVTAITRIGLANGQLTLGTRTDSAYKFPALRGNPSEILTLGSGGLIAWSEDLTAGTITVTDSIEVQKIADIDTLVSSTGKVYFKDDIQTSGNIAAATYETNVTAAELGYVSEVTSDIQAQLDAGVVGTEDSLNPLINRMVLDNILIVEAGAGATIRVLGPTGGDFTVIIHDSLTAVVHDSALAVTDDDITFVWIDEDGALQTATVGFPAELGGGEDSTVVQVATVGTASTSIVWISTHYDHKKDRLIDLHEFIEEIHSYSVHSGFEVSEGTSSNLGFDFGAAGTTNDMHSIHGWRATHADQADLTFIDDIYSGGGGTTFGNTVYGNNQAMTNNYYSKFRLWLVANNAGINEFHITRSTSEWADVAHAEVAGWPAVPAGYADSKIDLIGVVYKKGKTWDNLDGVKDWIITDFTATGVSSAGGAVGLGPEDVGVIVTDSLQQDPLTLTGSVNIEGVGSIRDANLGTSGGVGGGVTVASGATFTVNPTATFLDSVKIGTMEGSTFRDLNIKQTDAAVGAIWIEQTSGTKAYQIAVSPIGDLRFYDDDGSLSLALGDVTNLVYVPDSLNVNQTSRLTGNVKMEGDLNVEGQFTSTLSLDLAFSARNVVQLMATVGDAADDYADWANVSAGVHADNTTNYLTDHQSIQITIPNGGQDDGAGLDITDIDLEVWRDGDASATADYLLISVNILTQDITDIGSSELRLYFGCTNAYPDITDSYYAVLSGSLSNGWNYIKVAKSAFTEVGTGDWSDITGIIVKNNGTITDAEVVFSFDYIAMVRDDPDAAEPNPFQSEGTGEVWTADWMQEGNGNVWIVEESGRIAAMSGDGTSSVITTAVTYGDLDISGVDKTGGSSLAYFFRGANNLAAARINSTQLRLADSTETLQNVTMATAVGEMIWWKYSRQGTSHTLQVSKDQGKSWPYSVTTYTKTALTSIQNYIEDGQRVYSFGMSAVEYADEAGVAQRLKNGLSFDLSSNLTTHGTHDGKTTRIDVDENSIGFGGALHMDTDGNLVDADANVSADMPCHVMAIEAGTGSGKLVMLEGRMTSALFAWTPGKTVYITDATGAVGTGVGTTGQEVGWVVAAYTIYFNPQDMDID